MGFNVYLFLTISWFLHLGARIPALGYVHVDLLMVIVLCFVPAPRISIMPPPDEKGIAISRILFILIAYVIVTLPFVEWPGSVINRGIQNFIKAFIFYFFTKKFVKTEGQLKIFILVFLVCQTFRVLEPVYLHITSGYWGSSAYIGDGQVMDRLGGAPMDVINPNGLAFVILSILPFCFVFLSFNGWTKILSPIVIIFSVYALRLTASRSGFLGMVIILLYLLLLSKNKIVMAITLCSAVLCFFATLTPMQSDRYFSIVGDSTTANNATAEGRITGIENNFRVAFRRPLFGHGLGTSREANANFGGSDQPAHNLYAEVAQELGFVGLAIFLLYIKTVLIKGIKSLRYFKKRSEQESRAYIYRLVSALQVWFIMNLFFSFFSYGLSSYEWYLFPALCDIVSNAVESNKEKLVEANA